MEKTKYIFLFLLVISVGCEEVKPIDSNDMESMFEKVWDDFDQTYSYFEIKNVDWDSMYTANRSKIVNGKTTNNEFATTLAEMTVALKDLHVDFIVGNTEYRFQNWDQFTSNSPSNAPNYLSSISINTNTVQYGMIKDSNIAYMRVKTLSNGKDYEPLETVLSELPSKDALILDLRNNGGGNDGIARNFVNQLTTEERIYEYYRFRNGPGRNDFGDWNEARITPESPIDFNKPIVVITNRGVVSSAESFVSMLRTLPNTTLVGDTTRGATGNPKEYILSNGWRYRISRWQAVTPDFTFIEDHGIPPDVVVFNTDETMNEGRDLMLEKAIELLQ